MIILLLQYELWCALQIENNIDLRLQIEVGPTIRLPFSYMTFSFISMLNCHRHPPDVTKIRIMAMKQEGGEQTQKFLQPNHNWFGDKKYRTKHLATAKPLVSTFQSLHSPDKQYSSTPLVKPRRNKRFHLIRSCWKRFVQGKMHLCYKKIVIWTGERDFVWINNVEDVGATGEE